MDHTALARKITTTLFAAQSLGSAGFIAVSTVSSIVGATLSGNPALAGFPSAIYLLGSSLAALILGLVMDRIGRRGGWSWLVVRRGSGLAAWAIVSGSFLFSCLGWG
jgi:MFS family permease